MLFFARLNMFRLVFTPRSQLEVILIHFRSNAETLAIKTNAQPCHGHVRKPSPGHENKMSMSNFLTLLTVAKKVAQDEMLNYLRIWSCGPSSKADPLALEVQAPTQLWNISRPGLFGCTGLGACARLRRIPSRRFWGSFGLSSTPGIGRFVAGPQKGFGKFQPLTSHCAIFLHLRRMGTRCNINWVEGAYLSSQDSWLSNSTIMWKNTKRKIHWILVVKGLPRWWYPHSACFSISSFQSSPGAKPLIPPAWSPQRWAGQSGPTTSWWASAWKRHSSEWPVGSRDFTPNFEIHGSWPPQITLKHMPWVLHSFTSFKTLFTSWVAFCSGVCGVTCMVTVKLWEIKGGMTVGRYLHTCIRINRRILMYTYIIIYI